MSRTQPLDKEIQVFCRYHLGKGCFAPFTGQDWPAWQAFVYLLRCYSTGGGDAAIVAMRATLDAAQHTESILSVFVQAIPGVLDWGDVARLWPKICDRIYVKGAPADGVANDPRRIVAVEKSEVYRKGCDQVETVVRHHGWTP